MLEFNISINELDDIVLCFKPADDRKLAKISRLNERKRSEYLFKEWRNILSLTS